MSDQEKNAETVVIEEGTQDTPMLEAVGKEDAAEAGLRPEEIAMGEKAGVVVEKKEENAEEGEKKEDAEKKDPKKEAEKDLSAEEEAETIEKFNRNEKALYFKQKKEKEKRQTAEAERDLLKVQNEALKRELGEKKAKKEVDEDEDNLDAKLNKDLELEGEYEGKEDDEKVVTVKDLKDLEAKKQKAQEEAVAISKRLNEQEEAYRKKHADFDIVADLARKVMEEDKSGAFATKITLMASDPEADVAGFVYMLGRLHPDYKPGMEKGSEKGKDKIDRIVENAGKKPTSAALGGGSAGVRKVSVEELTVEDAAKLTPTQWKALPAHVKERVLKETCR